MSNIAKITNISIDNIDKVYEVNKSGVTKVMGVNLSTSGPTTKSYNIDIDHTKVDSDLTNFPLLINLSNSAGTNSYDVTDIFDTIGSDYNKIKILDSNGQQLYTEVENWDAANKTAQLWVKVPTVSSSETTRLTLDYSATSGNVDYISNDATDKAINLIIDKGSEGTYDTTHAYYPCIIKDSDTSYKMWYSGYDGSHFRIIYCDSTDGINWSNFQLSVNIGSQGTYDTSQSTQPFVIKESDVSYKMWYIGHDGSHNRIIYCTSTDGIHWSNFQMVVNYNIEGTYDTSGTFHPYVIKESSASYKMWYGGYDGSHYRILYCTSTDGISWSNHQMVVNIGSTGSYDTTHTYQPCVIKESNTSYKMWYSGYDGTNVRLIYCTSINGINWSNFQMVLDKGSEGTYDTVHVYTQSIIKESNKLYKIWYAGNNGSNYRILYATSEDGKNWTKNIANRVWDDDFSAIYHMSQDPSSGANSILDSTSNTNHGTPHGSMNSGDLVNGVIGKAIELDGSDDYIDILSNSSLSTGAMGSIDFWLYRNDDGGVDGYIHQKDEHPLIYTGGNGDLQIYWDRAHGLPVTDVYSDQYDNLGTGSWHHITATWNNSNTLSIFIDGVLWKTYTGLSLTMSTTGYEFGRYYNTNYFNGIIDEVRISKTARSADWVKATYHSNWDNLNSWS